MKKIMKEGKEIVVKRLFSDNPLGIGVRRGNASGGAVDLYCSQCKYLGDGWWIDSENKRVFCPHCEDEITSRRKREV